jgi:hypothetical protein
MCQHHHHISSFSFGLLFFPIADIWRGLKKLPRVFHSSYEHVELGRLSHSPGPLHMFGRPQVHPWASYRRLLMSIQLPSPYLHTSSHQQLANSMTLAMSCACTTSLCFHGHLNSLHKLPLPRQGFSFDASKPNQCDLFYLFNLPTLNKHLKWGKTTPLISICEGKKIQRDKRRGKVTIALHRKGKNNSLANSKGTIQYVINRAISSTSWWMNISTKIRKFVLQYTDLFLT